MRKGAQSYAYPRPISLVKVLTWVIASYMGILLLLNSVQTVLVLLIFLEFLSWLFALLINKAAFKYLVLQTYIVLAAILSLIMSPTFVILLLLLKLGMPPLHGWFLRLTFTMEKPSLLFFITVHKLPPVFLMGALLSLSSLVLPGVSIAISLILISISVTLVSTLMFSSLMHSGWMVMSLTCGKSFMYSYWGLYSLLTLTLSGLMLEKLTKMTSLKQTTPFSMFWLLKSGIPPFTIFWLKLGVMMALVSISGILIFALMMLVIMSVNAYFRVFTMSLNVESILTGWELPWLVALALLTIS